MSPVFPTAAALQSSFAPSSPFRRKAAQAKPAVLFRDDFPIWSTVDDVKNKVGQLSQEAQNDLSKASSKTQAQTGAIEMYSGRYYAACTMGGILACGPTHWSVTILDLVKCRRRQ